MKYTKTPPVLCQYQSLTSCVDFTSVVGDSNVHGSENYNERNYKRLRKVTPLLSGQFGSNGLW